MYYFRIEKLRHSSRAAEVFFATFVLKSCDFEAGAAKVYFVYYFCDECSENSPAKVPRWGPRKLFFSREDGGFRNKEFQTTVILIPTQVGTFGTGFSSSPALPPAQRCFVLVFLKTRFRLCDLGLLGWFDRSTMGNTGLACGIV